MSLGTDDTMHVEDAVISTSEDQSTKLPIMVQETHLELDTGFRILTEIIRQNKSACFPFMDEVDAKALGLWDYHNKVKTPMWINKILEKFNSNEYTSITEFAKDFRQMVENCYRYNSTDHAISKKAKRLEMAFESKLALLKKEMRDKTLLSVTSGRRFSLEIPNEDNNLVPVSRYGRIGNLREYSLLDDDSAKLVFDFVRCEETMLYEDEKKASYRERRQQELLYQRIAAAWIATVEENPSAKAIKTSAAVPEVGFFLHICESVLKFPELNMYQFERSLLIPEHSIFLSKIMTSLLCSYQERSQINHRPPMLFSTWNKRLKERFVKWFELVQKHNSYSVAADKIGIDVEFFKTLNWENPFVANNMESFANLLFEQKVQTVKALCDGLFTLQSVQNALIPLDAVQLKCMQLGKDYFGNQYIYFPQFCGDEVRVYRHHEHGVLIPIVEPDEIWTPPKPPSPDIEREPVIANGMDKPEAQTEASNDETKAEGEQQEVKMETYAAVDGADSDGKGFEPANTVHPEVAKAIQDPEGSIANLVPLSNPSGDPINESVQQEQNTSNATGTSDHTITGTSDGTGTSTGTVALDGAGRPKSDETVAANSTGTSKKPSNDAIEIPPESISRRPQRVRKQTTRYTDISAPSPRKSTRNRNNNTSQADNNSSKDAKSSKPRSSRRKEEKKSTKEPVVKYGNVNFEMLCDNVDGIQLLINQLESQNTQEFKSTYGREARENHNSLIEKLRWLYDELEPWNIKLQKARHSVQIKMKKEHDELQNATHKADPWTEELTTKNSYLFGENLTISHTNSPMSSTSSLDGDDEEYTHPYFTRKSQTDLETPPVEKQYDESLYELERHTLLDAALMELEEVLKSNMKGLLKIADRDELQENNPTTDRRTRNKVKQQNKVLGKIMQFAEDNCTVFPSLLPILVPNNDVFDTVDMVYLEEETRLQELAEERKRKRQQKQKRQLPKSFDEKEIIAHPLKKTKLNSCDEIDPVVKSLKKAVPFVSYLKQQSAIAIQMQNGQVVPAARLGDGRVVPIQRANGTSVASSVQELIESTHKEVDRKITCNVPTISLRPVQKDNNKPHAVNSNMPAAVVQNTTPVTVVLPSSVNQTSVQVAPGHLQQQVESISQASTVLTKQPASSMRSIILNGTRYSLVPQSNMNSSQILAGTSVPTTFVAQAPMLRPVLTPVQIINPTIKYHSTIKHNKPSNVVLVPVQNCTTASIGPVRVGTTPVMGILTSPQRQLQFQAPDKKS